MPTLSLLDIKSEIKRRHLENWYLLDVLSNYKDSFIIYGAASVAVTDREGHKITIPALKKAVSKFMENPKYRDLNVFHCLLPDTKVLRKNGGYVPISEIKVKDLVITHNDRPRSVLNVIVHQVNMDIICLTLDNGEIINITDEHPILTRDRGWVKAGWLTTEDVLLHVKMNTCPQCGKETHHKFCSKLCARKYPKSDDTINKLKENRRGKGTGKREHYILSEKHNSQQRKGKTWEEAYGYKYPTYNGLPGEKNPQYGNVGRITGEKNPNWKNGISFIPYGQKWTLKFKEYIRILFGRVCQMCGKPESENGTRKLHVHHKDFNKENINIDNLTVLCTSCHIGIHNADRAKIRSQRRKEGKLINGTNILSIAHRRYIGTVYNLTVSEDNTYSGRGIIYHNSDVQVGEILPYWIHPITGKVYRTEVNDSGWWVVAKLRGDLEIAKKVREEVEKGNLRAFSIAGTATNKSHDYDPFNPHENINDLEIYECVVPETRIQTLNGEKEIKDIVLGDYVLTHNMHFKPVDKLINHYIDGVVCEIPFDNGSTLRITPNHQVLTKQADKDVWERADDLTYKTPVYDYLGIWNGLGKTNIKKIVLHNYKGFVYNLEVKDDHSYIANNIVVKNCTICVDGVNQMAKFSVIYH